jgi:transposase
MTGKRKRYSAEFKAKVALEALRGELTAAQLATKHGIRPTMVAFRQRQGIGFNPVSQKPQAVECSDRRARTRIRTGQP